MDEVDRIKKAYEKRELDGKSRLYSPYSPSAVYIRHQREREVLRIIPFLTGNDLASKKILDLGCGNGGEMYEFLRYGASRANIRGIDLLPEKIEAAKRNFPDIDFRCGNSEKLPYDDGSFDIIICYTVFSSIFDDGMKKRIASEMLRVLKRNGFVLWYDFFMNNPRNPDVIGMKKKEITSLFPGCCVKLKRTTLAPPVSRRIAPFSFVLCALLESLRIFNTHYIGIISKNDVI